MQRFTPIARRRDFALGLLILSGLLPLCADAQNKTPEELLYSAQPPPKAADPKIEEALQAVERLARQGFPGETPETWASGFDPAVTAVSTYTGLSGNIVTLMMAGNTEGTGVLATTSTALEKLGVASTVYELVKDVAQGRGDLFFLNGAKYYLSNFLSKAGSGWAMAGAGVGIVDYSLTALGNRAIELSNMKWWDAYVNFQLTEHKEEQFWVDAFVRGGPDAVGAETDRFWLETAEVRGEDFFKTSNPNHVADYRNRFMRTHVMPWVQGWARAQQYITRRDAELALIQMQAVMRQANVRILGGVTNYFEGISEDKGSIRFVVTVRNNQNKVLATETTGSGGFEMKAIDLKDIPYGSLTVSVVPEGIQSFSSSPRGSSFSFTLGDKYALKNGLRTKVNGVALIATIPDFRLGVTIRRTATGAVKYTAEIPEPAVKPDRNAESDGRLGAGFSRYASREIPFNDSSDLARIEQAWLSAYNETVTDSYHQANDAIGFNRDFRAGRLNEQKQYEAATAVRREADARIATNEKALQKIRDDANAIDKKWREKYDAEYAAIRKRDAAIEKRLEEIRQEAQRNNSEFDAASQELSSLLQGWEQAESSAHWSPNGESGRMVPADQLTKMEELAASTQEKLPGLLEKMAALADKARSSLDQMQNLNAQRLESMRQNFGTDLPEGVVLEDARYDIIRAQAAKTVQETIKRVNLTRQAQTNVSAVKRYAQARNAGKPDTAALVSEMLALTGRLPSPEQVKAGGAKYGATKARLEPFLTAMRGRAFAGETTAPVLPADLLSKDGSDGELIDAGLKSFGELRTSEVEVVGDLFGKESRLPNAFGRLMELMQKYSSRWSDFTQEQMTQLQPGFARFGAISTARGQSGLYGMGELYDTLRLLQPLGKMPAQRLEAVAAKNRELAAELKQTRDKVRAWPAVDASAGRPAVEERMQQVTGAYRAAAKWYGRLPDLVSLANYTLRGELYQALEAGGALKTYRAVKELPAAPESVSVNGAPVPLDGRLVVLKAATLPKLSAQMMTSYAQMGFNPAGEIQFEFSRNGSLATEVLLYDQGEFMDVKAWQYKYALPVMSVGGGHVVSIKVRHKSPTGKTSFIDGEPGLTIIVMP